MRDGASSLRKVPVWDDKLTTGFNRIREDIDEKN